MCSLRCQSLIHLKLYTMRRHEVRESQKIITEYFAKSGLSEVTNGNTPSPMSPTNSIGSQVRDLFVKNYRNVCSFCFIHINICSCFRALVPVNRRAKWCHSRCMARFSGRVATLITSRAAMSCGSRQIS